MNNEVKTIILRFRDLGRPEGYTIEEHNKKISSEGYVWWGWWNKPHESVEHVADLAKLGYEANEKGLKIYLVDSGRKLLYQCVCNGIKINSDCRKSPETGHTPEYYNDQSLYMWFKLGSIERSSESELKRFSYHEIRSFFLDDSDYSRFHNKKIYSIDELIQQNRTVWFIRLARPTDPDFEIILLGSEFVQPYHFSQRYYHAPGNILLWLSDLHLSDNIFPSSPPDRSLFSHLNSATNKFDNVGGLLISGDITSRGEKSGFDDAIKLIQDINTVSGKIFLAENIAVCPGNHDFKIINSDFLVTDDLKIPEKVSDNQSSIDDYARFYQEIYHLGPNEYIACGKKLLLPSGVTVEVACLNSLLIQQYKNFKGHGYISEEQLNYVQREMGWDKTSTSSAIRIVMMHHHYMPTCFVEEMEINRPSSVVYDADRLMQWLVKNNVTLLLHGHKHKRFISQVNYPIDTEKVKVCLDRQSDDTKQITILGMGGTAADCSENIFATIDFEPNNIIIKFHEIKRGRESRDSIRQTITIAR